MNSSGLIFTQEQVQAARQNRQNPPFSAAWDKFQLTEADGDSSAAINLDALRWILADDATAADRAGAELDTWNAPDVSFSVIDSARRLFAVTQALAMLRGHTALTDSRLSRTFDVIETALTALDARAGAVHERTWLMAVRLAAGVAANRDAVRDAAAEDFRDIVAMINPNGYVLSLVESKDDESLVRTVQFAHALVLAAEVGELAGLGLWSFEYRRVGAMTAALYPLYYYYYPEKWPWRLNSPFEIGRKSTRKERALFSEGDIALEATQAIFKAHAAFLEIINLRTAASPVRAITLILDELRPVTDLLGGGAVTLTHALPPPPKRRGLFGR